MDVYKYSPIKPLYMLIKVDVDKQIVYNQDKAEKYAENHCNSLEYALVDWYYPDNEQYPYIAKWLIYYYLQLVSLPMLPTY